MSTLLPCGTESSDAQGEGPCAQAGEDLPKRLRTKADMISLGEKIAFGSDSNIMREAADDIEHLRRELYAAWDEIATLRPERKPVNPPLGPDDMPF